MLKDVERGAQTEADHIRRSARTRKETAPHSLLRISYAHLKATKFGVFGKRRSLTHETLATVLLGRQSSL